MVRLVLGTRWLGRPVWRGFQSHRGSISTVTALIKHFAHQTRFNPTVVRLVHGLARQFRRVSLVFQSHRGSISTPRRSVRLVEYSCFNPTVVRLVRSNYPPIDQSPACFNPTVVRLVRVAGPLPVVPHASFNPTVVRLVLAYTQMSGFLFICVSIPPWFD